MICKSVGQFPIFLAMVLSAIVPLPGLAIAQERTSPDSPAAAGRTASVSAQLVDQTDLFVAGQDGYHTYRIPALIRAADGSLLAFCEGRKTGSGDSGDIDLLVKRMEPGGARFSPQQIVWDDGPNTCGNPCPVLDAQTGTLWLWMTHNLGEDRESEIVAGKSRGTRTAWLCLSQDHGRSWTTPVEMTAQVKKPEWTWYATGPGCGIQMRTGRLVIPCDHIAGSAQWGSHVILSDDHGKTWFLGGSAGPQTNECEVVETSDGRLLLNMRNYNRRHTCRAVAESRDGGLSWSELRYDTALVEPVCQASIRRLDGVRLEGRPILAFSNPADPKQRRRLTVRFSGDDGQTWPWSVVVWEGPAAYSCLAALPEGTLLVLYERGEKHPYEKITLARLVVSLKQAE